MSKPLTEVCTLAIEALRNAAYNESTITEYQKTFNHLQLFALKFGSTTYTPELGTAFASDVLSERTGKYSLYREKRRRRCTELFNHYIITGCFVLSLYHLPTGTPDTSLYKEIHSRYLLFLKESSLKRNTIASYRNVSCKFLKFLEASDIYDFEDATPDTLIGFISELRTTWGEGSLRTAKSAMCSFFSFMNSKTLKTFLERIKTIRIKKILPVLTESDQNKLWILLNKPDKISSRDKAIVLLSLMTGIRSCDIINLKTDDINWQTDSISFIQQKTGNFIVLPLFPAMGNAISDYLINERPKSGRREIFLRQLAPYEPLADHASCYAIIKRVFTVAGINLDKNICGTRLLRHNAASSMLKHETPLEIIAAILGHSNPDSTNIYITTDDRTLQMCVLPLIPVSKGVLS